MKKVLLPVIALLFAGLLPESRAYAQCGAGYTQAQLNWDNLDYYYFSGLNVAPYGYKSGATSLCYVTTAQEQTQNFAFGPQKLTITTSAAGMVKGENGTHTGELAGYTGDDAMFTPSSAGQTITLTFSTEVMNANFTLYDIDRNAVLTVSAVNAALAPQVVTATTQASTILTVAGTPFKTISDLTGTTLATSDNRGSATISVAGPVKSIVITATTLGSDATFWLSDINACVTGSFPTNWHQGLNNEPFTGPTQNMPDYFLITPDNNSCYMMDPATGNAYYLFTDAAKTYMNSFAYDATNKWLYYISEGTSLDMNNKALKKYDFNTNTVSTVIANLTTLGFPTFNSGLESAAASFYNDQLYIGVEGGQFDASNSRESTVYRVDFDASHVPVSACQVYATPSYSGSNIVHDWADFLVKDGTLINYNSAKNGTNYANSSYTHFDMMTGAATKYTNPIPGSKFSGQAGMSWNGTTYMIYDSVYTYNAGTISNKKKIQVITVPGDPAPVAWAGNAGDGSDPFRPMADFGDAPASYDPDPVSPAVHERSELIRLGSGWDKEWLKRGVSGTDDADDGIPTVTFLPPGSGGYAVKVYVTNTSGANATMIAWLDYNNNGVFDASEAITPITVPSAAGLQNFYLYWPSITNSFTIGQFCWLRVRITAASAGMTSAHATGYFKNGEVEDYKVRVDNYPLATNSLNFSATLMANRYTHLDWTITEENGSGGYEIEKSADSRNWTSTGVVTSDGLSGNKHYTYDDQSPYMGTTYYRLKFLAVSGADKYSEVRSVKKTALADMVRVAPNPATTVTHVTIESADANTADIRITNAVGQEMWHRTIAVRAGSTDTQIPLSSEWKAGLYLVRVTMNGETILQKLIIQ